MGRLPPAEKLPLAVRKNVRDEFENNKSDLEQQLSELLGETWTIEITPNAIWPYHNDGYAKDSLGSCIKGYIEGAIYQFKYLTSRYENLAKEINTISHAHVLTLDLEETSPPRFSYGGCDVLDGKFRILFVEQYLGTNIDYACQEENLFKALNAAPEPAGRPMSFLTRLGIRTEYDPTIAEATRNIAEQMGKSEGDVKVTPNFEDSYAKLKAFSDDPKNKDQLRDDWQKNLGSFTLKYFEALASHMKYIKVGEDDMIQEGFNEAVDKREVAFRVVDKLSNPNANYNEVVIEDGVLYLQCKPTTWGVNIDYVAEKLIDIL